MDWESFVKSKQNKLSLTHEAKVKKSFPMSKLWIYFS